MNVSLNGIGWVTPIALGTGGSVDDFIPAPGCLSNALMHFNPNPPYPRFGRMDSVSKAAMAAVVLAMEDAGFKASKRKKRVGIIAATRTGCLETDRDYFQDVVSGKGASPSPHRFAYTLPSTFIGDASIHFGLTGPGFVIQEKHALALTALSLALDAIGQGEVGRMVVGAYDAGIPPSPGRNAAAKAYAVFMLVEKKRRRGAGYGRIEEGPDAAIRFRGEPMQDLFHILKAVSFSPERFGESRNRGSRSV